ncbi:MAG: lysine--tRNA ligase [Rhodospirillales bacterium]|nr:lysine--tRNA ligase [Rhodospirillales bacterium]
MTTDLHPAAAASPAVLLEAADRSNAWPFVEARNLAKRLGETATAEPVLFETGYGPSGLPHIGTFGEVVRTTMVRHAFTVLTGRPTRLLAFSDDMDALRKVPDNVPNRGMLADHLGQPLTSIPDPFGEYESFGAHNNARLRGFLDRFGFDYEFGSSTAYYKSGRFDAMLRRVLAAYDDITRIILPTLGPERRATYSPFLPVCATTGRVLQVAVVARDVDAGTIVYEDEGGRRVETPVTGGRCKLQWKADWAMRWAALGVDYEMAGKDLIDSVQLASRICRVLKARPPTNLIYELFLDENGEKISKSRGNGLAVEDWLRYAPRETLAYFMYNKPKTAKRLHIGLIPKTVDEYIANLHAYPGQDEVNRLNNPVWHVHAGRPPGQAGLISYALLLNLVAACHTEDRNVLWHYVVAYYGDEAIRNEAMITQLIDHAIAYYRDFVKVRQRHRLPEDAEKAALSALAEGLAQAAPAASAEELQTVVYEVGKAHADVFPSLKDWFRALYQILLGQDEGPRMGSFIALYGRDKTLAMLEDVLAGRSLGPAPAS